MSENNGTTKGGKRAGADYGPVCESEAALNDVPKPARGEKYTGALNGKTYWLWASGAWMAGARLFRHLGGTVAKAGKPVARADVAAGLAALSPEDRAVLIAQYVPAPKGKGK